ncbi:hypothetical protein QBC43DRAFT_291485 [Cladorrhinum sp. PSN259]|nr:hypothetical protein QBC43DRAFT_291485 [Cladorrhinum sp. PSN259]
MGYYKCLEPGCYASFDWHSDLLSHFSSTGHEGNPIGGGSSSSTIPSYSTGPSLGPPGLPPMTLRCYKGCGYTTTSPLENKDHEFKCLYDPNRYPTATSPTSKLSDKGAYECKKRCGAVRDSIAEIIRHEEKCGNSLAGASMRADYKPSDLPSATFSKEGYKCTKGCLQNRYTLPDLEAHEEYCNGKPGGGLGPSATSSLGPSSSSSTSTGGYSCTKKCGARRDNVSEIIAHEKTCTFGTSSFSSQPSGSSTSTSTGKYPCNKGCGEARDSVSAIMAHEHVCTSGSSLRSSYTGTSSGYGGTSSSSYSGFGTSSYSSSYWTEWKCMWYNDTFISRASRDLHEPTCPSRPR